MKKLTVIVMVLALSIGLIGCAKPDSKLEEYLAGIAPSLLEGLGLQGSVDNLAFEGYRLSTVSCDLTGEVAGSKEISDLCSRILGGVKDSIRDFCGQEKIEIDNSRFDGQITVRSEGKEFVYYDDILHLPEGVMWSAKAAADLHDIEIAHKAKDYDKAIDLADAFVASYGLYEQSARAQELLSTAKEARLQRLAKSMDYMRTSKDEVKGITWYHDNTTSRYDNTNNFHLYIGDQNGSIWLRMRARYTASRWLFIEKYIFSVDGVNYTIDAGYSAVKRDVADSGDIYEWYDVTPSEGNLNMVRAIIGSTKTILRSEGEDHYGDRTISSAEKKALQHVLDAYEYLQSK